MVRCIYSGSLDLRDVLRAAGLVPGVAERTSTAGLVSWTLEVDDVAAAVAALSDLPGIIGAVQSL